MGTQAPLLGQTRTKQLFEQALDWREPVASRSEPGARFVQRFVQGLETANAAHPQGEEPRDLWRLGLLCASL
ncbi:MAG: hypothetical protein P8R43_00250, partial [Planctomycetota bacterium]|nr:hypothetical protein [Planctomycetota bacterium]